MTRNSRPGVSGSKVRLYRFRNRLKEKAGGAQVGSGPGSISVAALAAAEAEFQKMAEDYPDWVQGLLGQMEEHYRRCVGLPERRPALFKGLNDIAHDLKGQGGTFGYPLVTFIADSLYRFTRPREHYEDEQVAIVRAHLDAIRAVVAGRVKGDGGTIGRDLIAAMQRAVDKLSTDPRK